MSQAAALRRFAARAAERAHLRRWPVRFGSLRRITPVSRVFGLDRGLPIDRYYIEGFLGRHAADIRGRVLEIADSTYTRRFGGERVLVSDVLHATAGNAGATIVGDLSSGAGLPTEAFDCIILTQTLQYLYDLRAAARQLARILRPGGVLLATAPGISQVSRYDMDRWGEFWRLTSLSGRRLFEETGEMDVQVEVHGNVLAAVGFLHGLAAEELRPEELNHFDPDYEVVIAIRAVKTGATAC